ncbi:MAG TPA: TldD/PmbA family protein [Methanothermococcus okinawensis]|uniref:TldD protein n=1 Tax=Methanofervidicoccus abyssi TaxID=2082189 RepID=A0A401HRK6_9EURY|nr:TldD/PmbA family protein [Methanofervidicoccus abyssi]GBF36830.1 TldD protein [Methanofervidicoccus abyssi]HIP16671.1 TldD/PmbA family protein [Methanothermococcus okinawensis]
MDLEYYLEKLESLSLDAYWDIRIINIRSNNIILKDGSIEEISSGTTTGVAVRVLYKNGWGYGNSHRINFEEIKTLLERAYRMAKLSNENSKKTVILKDVKIYRDHVKSIGKINPKDVDVEEKKGYIIEAHKNMLDKEGMIVSTSVLYSDILGNSLFVSSEGALIRNEVSRVLMGITAVARDNSNIQYASERIGGYGFEVVKEGNIEELSKNTKERAIRLLRAKPCPKGEFKAVLDPELAGVFIHEAVGHASEADLVLQNDSVFKDKIGERVGSDYVTVIDNPLIENAFGYYKYDSEGVKGRETVIIEEGILKSYLHTRETAGRLDMEVTGNGRAEGLNKPLVRMSNTYIKPGDWDFQELIEDTKNGIFLRGSRGGQVDTGKGLFQFNAVEAFLIENGELTTPLRDAGLSGEITEILHNVDGVTKEFKLSVGYCGKNGQSVPVGDGGGSIRTKTIIS